MKIIYGDKEGWCINKPYEIRLSKTEPFYVKNRENKQGTITILKTGGQNPSQAPTIAVEYSSDGTTWTSMGSTSTSGISVNIPANGKLYFRAKANVWGAMGSTGVSYNKFVFTDTTVDVGGNIMSLLYGSDFTSAEVLFPTTSSYCLQSLFYGATNLINAGDLALPAMTLAQQCYTNMFYGCTNLLTAPALPATTLATSCYSYMFQGCSSLVNITSILPAMTLASSCYMMMFAGCSSLNMAPELPAMTLAASCYTDMFYNCSSLEVAPYLPAETLVSTCYGWMFQGCSSLHEVRCNATDISASNCTKNWLKDTAVSGTFYKNAGMSGWTRDESGIPSGWTVENM